MSIKLFVDNQSKYIVRWQMPPVWDMQDVRLTNQKALDLFARRAPEPLYVIVDLSKSHSVPLNFIAGLSHVSRNSPPNWVLTVIVSPGHALRTLFSVAAKADKLVAEKYYLVPTVENARLLIERERRLREPDRYA